MVVLNILEDHYDQQQKPTDLRLRLGNNCLSSPAVFVKLNTRLSQFACRQKAFCYLDLGKFSQRLSAFSEGFPYMQSHIFSSPFFLPSKQSS